MAGPVYDVIGVDYADQRRPDPRWQAEIDAILGRSKTVVNIGAGTGSYEPHCDFWLVRDYLPELNEVWSGVPTVEEVAATIGIDADVRELPVPWDCVDGFLPAYWRRPEAYLNPAVRQSMSGLRLLDPEVLRRGIAHLRSDLDDGTWQRRNAALLETDLLDVGWRLIFNRDSAIDR